MTASDSLVSRLEAAEVGSRELDAAMAVVADGAVEVVGDWRYNDEGRARHVEPFTTLVDAALALAERVLPEGWTVEIKTGARPFNRAIVHPKYTMENKQDRCPMGLSKGSPALALCIAILKAKKAFDKSRQAGVCICVARGDGPEGCGICNETGKPLPAALGLRK